LHILKYCSIEAAENYLNNINEIKKEELNDFPRSFHVIKSNLNYLGIVKAKVIEKTNLVYYEIEDYIKYLFNDNEFLYNLNYYPKNVSFEDNICNTNYFKKILIEAYENGYIPLLLYFYFDNFIKYVYSLNKKSCGGLYFIFSNVNIKYYHDTRNIHLFGLSETEEELEILYKELNKQIIILKDKKISVYNKMFKKNVYVKVILLLKGADLEQFNKDNNIYANNSNRPYFNLNLFKQSGHLYDIYINGEYENYKRSFKKYFELYNNYNQLNEEDKKILKKKLHDEEGFKIDIYNYNYELVKKLDVDIIDFEIHPISHILEDICSPDIE
jgi:hypothetical protein